MSSALLSIVLDITVLVFLGVTIYYALKLSRSLNNFRAYKKEFNGLITELNTHIEQAYEAVKALKERSNRSADDLEYLLRESQQMAEELKIINASGDNLAGRLEKLTDKGRAASKGADSVEDFSDEYNEELYENVAKLERGGGPSFAIQDREFDDADDDPDGGDFQSEAEKDLYKALKKNKKSGKK